MSVGKNNEFVDIYEKHSKINKNGFYLSKAAQFKIFYNWWKTLKLHHWAHTISFIILIIITNYIVYCLQKLIVHFYMKGEEALKKG